MSEWKAARALGRNGRGILAALVLLGGSVLVGAEDPPPGEPGQPGAVTWARMAPLLAAGMGAAWDGEERWLLVLDSPEGAEGERHEEVLRQAAREALTAAIDDLEWMGSVVLTRGLPPPAPGEPWRIPLPDDLRTTLFDDGVFADPLRRFVAAALRSRGLDCAGCLSALRPSRDVEWKEVRRYLGAFIHVRRLDAEGRVDLQVGTLANALPRPAECDRDLAAAAYAVMRDSALKEAVVQQTISSGLIAEMRDLEEVAPEEATRRINDSLPWKILSDRLAMRPIMRRLPAALDRHGLRCTDCARRIPRR